MLQAMFIFIELRLPFSTAVWATAVLIQLVGTEQKLQDGCQREIWMIGLWTVGPFDCNLIQMDDFSAAAVP